MKALIFPKRKQSFNLWNSKQQRQSPLKFVVWPIPTKAVYFLSLATTVAHLNQRNEKQQEDFSVGVKWSQTFFYREAVLLES